MELKDTFKILKDKLQPRKTWEDARKAIDAMSNDTFDAFGNEVHYAMKHYYVGYLISQLSIARDEGGSKGDVAIDAAQNYSRIHQEILDSPLYESIRVGLVKRYSVDVPANFQGWTGPMSRSESDSIQQATRVIMEGKMLQYSGPAKSEIEAAQKTIGGFGIKGVFVDVPQNDLLKRFFEQYGPKKV